MQIDLPDMFAVLLTVALMVVLHFAFAIMLIEVLDGSSIGCFHWFSVQVEMFLGGWLCRSAPCYVFC